MSLVDDRMGSLTVPDAELDLVSAGVKSTCTTF